MGRVASPAGIVSPSIWLGVFTTDASLLSNIAARGGKEVILRALFDRTAPRAELRHPVAQGHKGQLLRSDMLERQPEGFGCRGHRAEQRGRIRGLQVFD